MDDYIVGATAADATIRAFSAVSTNTVKDAAKIHNLSPLATAALGRALTAAGLMSRTLKEEKDAITIQIKGDGPLGGIVVVTDARANVRGYVHNPGVSLPLNEKGKFDVSGALGKGYLNVIRDLGLKEPYVGSVRLISGEIAEDIAYYYLYSEQTPSVVSLGVLVDADGSVINAGGFIIQLMPGASENAVEILEKRIADIPPVTGMLSEGKTPEDVLKVVLEGLNPKFTEATPLRFSCTCSRERMERNMISLGKKELEDIINEQGGAEVECHFCNTKYQFSKEDIERLLAEAIKQGRA